jgi:quercetin dioxygenase-like cupin family protein
VLCGFSYHKRVIRPPALRGREKALDLVMRRLLRFATLHVKRAHTVAQIQDHQKENNMFDQEILASQVKAERFPFSSEGEITLAVRNKNYALGPVMLHLVMKPGSVIPAHLHEGVAEVLYVVEGDFINEGKQYPSGTSLHVKASKPHGPHSTESGCTVLVLWTDKAATQDANLDDFKIAEALAA